MKGYRQEFVVAAGTAAFGEENMNNPKERLFRFGEESNEALQAGGLTREEAHRLVDYAYDRPVGELSQELAGVMVCTYALANAHSIDLEEVTDREVQRVITKCRALAAKHAAKPLSVRAA